MKYTNIFKSKFAFICLSICYFQNGLTQCANESNITSYTYNGVTYEVVEENQTWINAAACAVERGGHLIVINDANENAALFANLTFWDWTNTTATDGGGAGYLWIGGNDITSEGEWIWDGTNSGSGIQFWSGDANGTPIGGLYNNWGNEPDNFGAGQNGLAYAITNWPQGLQEQWNDLDINNSLYYLIEYPFLSVPTIPTTNEEKILLKIIDMMGRETEFILNTPLIFIYSDGTRERVMKFEE